MWSFKQTKHIIVFFLGLLFFGSLNALNTDIQSLVQNSVNEFTGDVNLNVPLLNIEGRNGLDVNLNATYNSNVQQQIQTWNQDSYTGILGVGWSFGIDRIIRNHKKTAQAYDDDYYLSLNGAFIEIEKTSTDTELDENNNEVSVHNYTCKMHKSWILKFYPEDDRWVIDLKNGNILEFGNTPEARTSAIKWGDWIGATVKQSFSYFDYTGNQVNVNQDLFTTSWCLSKKTHYWGDEINYEYMQIKERVGESSIAYTKAMYLKKITDVYGKEIIFNYEEKDTCEYIDPHQEMRSENIDPANYDENNLPVGDAYQEIFQTKYLSNIVVQKNDLVMNTIRFEYQLNSYNLYSYLSAYSMTTNPELSTYDSYPDAAIAAINNYAAENYNKLDNELKKRYLTKISSFSSRNAEKSYLDFEYYQSSATIQSDGGQSVMPGLLRSISNKMGASIDYNYKVNTITNSQKTLMITRPVSTENPERDYGYYLSWFYSDYGIIGWVSSDRYMHLTLYEWDGYWKTTFLDEVYIANWKKKSNRRYKSEDNIYLKNGTCINSGYFAQYKWESEYIDEIIYTDSPENEVDSLWSEAALTNYIFDDSEYNYIVVEGDTIDKYNYYHYSFEYCISNFNGDSICTTPNRPVVTYSLTDSIYHYGLRIFYGVRKDPQSVFTEFPKEFTTCSSDEDSINFYKSFYSGKPYFDFDPQPNMVHYYPDISFDLNPDFFLMRVNGQSIAEEDDPVEITDRNEDRYAVAYHKNTGTDTWDKLSIGYDSSEDTGGLSFDINLNNYQITQELVDSLEVPGKLVCGSGDDYFVFFQDDWNFHKLYIWNEENNSWQLKPTTYSNYYISNYELVAEPDFYGIMTRFKDPSNPAATDTEYFYANPLVLRRNSCGEFVKVQLFNGIHSTAIGTGGGTDIQALFPEVSEYCVYGSHLTATDCIELTLTPGTNYVVLTGKYKIPANGNYATFRRIVDLVEDEDNIIASGRYNMKISDLAGPAITYATNDFVITSVENYYLDKGIREYTQSFGINYNCSVQHRSQDSWLFGQRYTEKEVPHQFMINDKSFSIGYTFFWGDVDHLFNRTYNIDPNNPISMFPDFHQNWLDAQDDSSDIQYWPSTNVGQFGAYSSFKNKTGRIGAIANASNHITINDYDLNSYDSFSRIAFHNRYGLWKGVHVINWADILSSSTFPEDEEEHPNRVLNEKYNTIYDLTFNDYFDIGVKLSHTSNNHFLIDANTPGDRTKIGFIRNEDIVRSILFSNSSDKFIWDLDGTPENAVLREFYFDTILQDDGKRFGNDSLWITRLTNMDMPDIVVDENGISNLQKDIAVASIYLYDNNSVRVKKITYDYNCDTAKMNVMGTNASYCEVKKQVNDDLGYVLTRYYNGYENFPSASLVDSLHRKDLLRGKKMHSLVYDDDDNLFSETQNFYRLLYIDGRKKIVLHKKISTVDGYPETSMYRYDETNGRLTQVEKYRTGYPTVIVSNRYWDEVYSDPGAPISNSIVQITTKTDNRITSDSFIAWDLFDGKWAIKATYKYKGDPDALSYLPSIPSNYPEFCGDWHRKSLILEYDEHMRPVSQIGDNHIKSNIFYNQENGLPLFTSQVCEPEEVLAESFEYPDNLVIDHTPYMLTGSPFEIEYGSGKTGEKSMKVSHTGNLFKMNFYYGKTYKISYWQKKHNTASDKDIELILTDTYTGSVTASFNSSPISELEWELKEFFYTHDNQSCPLENTYVTIEIGLDQASEGDYQLLDNLRIAPVDARLSSYTSDNVLSRHTSTTNSHNHITYTTYNYLDEKCHTLDTDGVPYSSTNVFMNQTKNTQIYVPAGCSNPSLVYAELNKNLGISASTLDKGFYESFDQNKWTEDWYIDGTPEIDSLRKYLHGSSVENIGLLHRNFSTVNKNLIIEFEATLGGENNTDAVEVIYNGPGQKISRTANNEILWYSGETSVPYRVNLPADEWHHYMFVIRKTDSSTAYDMIDLYIDGTCINADVELNKADYNCDITGFIITGQNTGIDNIAYLVNPSLSFEFMTCYGKKTQSVKYNMEDDTKHILQKHVYDLNGVEKEKYPPVPISYFNGRFVKDNCVQPCYDNYYNAINYSSNFEYEKSLRMRVTRSEKPTLSISEYYVNRYYGTQSNCSMGWTKGDSSFVKSRLFEPDELSYSNTIDKDNNGVVIQKDRIGRLISKTTFTSSAILERSYIYDEYGRLCGEISPALSQILSLSGATEITQAQQEMYMTTFRYDEKNRQISKTLPGNLRIDVVYDRYGRIVLKQDNRLREMDYWSFSKYDQYGRTILSGIFKNPDKLSRDSLQNYCDSYTGDMYEVPSGINFVIQQGYTNYMFPDINNCFIWSVNYYDNYDCDRNGTDDNTFTPVQQLDTGNALKYPSGQITMTKVRVMELGEYPEGIYDICPFDKKFIIEGSSIDIGPGFEMFGEQIADIGTDIDMTYFGTGWIEDVIFYDKKGQVIHTQNNNLAGMQTVTNEYNWAGQLTKSMQVQQVENTYIETRKTFVYNRTGNLLKSYCKIDNDEEILAEEYDYDEFGRVSAVNKHVHDTVITDAFNTDFSRIHHYDFQERGLQTVNFKYDYLGRLEMINNPRLTGTDLFGMQIMREKLTSYMEPFSDHIFHDGRVNAVIWNTADNFGLPGLSNDKYYSKMAYVYSYDSVGRMKKADFTYLNGSTWDTNNYFGIENMHYDENGNIQSLRRFARDENGVRQSIDDLTYSYSGNRLIGVTDNASITGTGFIDGFSSSTEDEYLYDSNGNMIKDRNKGFDIRYNLFNLPELMIKRTDDADDMKNRIRFVYSATGERLQKIVTADDRVTQKVNYVNGLVYTHYAEDTASEDEIVINTSFGRQVRDFTAQVGEQQWRYEYELKDHLGNIRVVFTENTDGTALVIQNNTFYPFGMKVPMLCSQSTEYRFIGKNREIIDEHGLNWIYWGKRFLDPQIGRWHSLDPAEQFDSPYVYCGNNPANFVELDGAISLSYRQEQYAKLQSLYRGFRGMSLNAEDDWNYAQNFELQMLNYEIDACGGYVEWSASVRREQIEEKLFWAEQEAKKSYDDEFSLVDKRNLGWRNGTADTSTTSKDKMEKLHADLANRLEEEGFKKEDGTAYTADDFALLFLDFNAQYSAEFVDDFVDSIGTIAGEGGPEGKKLLNDIFGALAKGSIITLHDASLGKNAASTINCVRPNGDDNMFDLSLDFHNTYTSAGKVLSNVRTVTHELSHIQDLTGNADRSNIWKSGHWYTFNRKTNFYIVDREKHKPVFGIFSTGDKKEQYAMLNSNQIMLNIKNSNIKHNDIYRKHDLGSNYDLRTSHTVHQIYEHYYRGDIYGNPFQNWRN